ncbi:tigger transposable element-derived protein 1-like [Diorhabda sublineata]|uniref:tigger transposable element-derived protein 1-like n=1 Tax=Diorhabda sublineata TaxID=1163346 RepID=UPI0024E0C895|nr:tigger transposable element-derived protein 1-like [Diorhabda sublineata]
MGDNEKEKKATRKSISLKTKMEVIRRLDSGKRQTLISASLNLPTSTIRTIMKNKEKILSSATAATSSSATRITRSRNNIIEEMEKRLSIWIDDEIGRNMPLSQSIIMEKARRIFNYIQAETIDKSETFVASRGWFNRFKHRNNLHNIKITGEFKAAKDRLTLLLGGNVSGDFKLKPLLIYHSKNPRAMKGISKSTLPVIWESNKKSWITWKILQDWFTEHSARLLNVIAKLKNLNKKHFC